MRGLCFHGIVFRVNTQCNGLLVFLSQLSRVDEAVDDEDASARRLFPLEAVRAFHAVP